LLLRLLAFKRRSNVLRNLFLPKELSRHRRYPIVDPNYFQDIRLLDKTSPFKKCSNSTFRLRTGYAAHSQAYNRKSCTISGAAMKIQELPILWRQSQRLVAPPATPSKQGQASWTRPKSWRTSGQQEPNPHLVRTVAEAPAKFRISNFPIRGRKIIW
jgi:hypothetical protein